MSLREQLPSHEESLFLFKKKKKKKKKKKEKTP